MKIEDKDTHEVLLFIERAKATMLTKTLVKEIAEKWIENEFVNILKDYWNNFSENNISRKQKNIWKQELMQTIKMQTPFKLIYLMFEESGCKAAEGGVYYR